MKANVQHVRTVYFALVTAIVMALTLGARERRPSAAAQTPSAPPAIVLSPTIPGDITVGSDTSLAGLQADFDIFSWNSFIALNWPPGPDGSADPAQKPGGRGDNRTVWERWQDA